VLVTHDRFMLDRVSTVLLALDGEGGSEFFADYAQWEATVARSTGGSVKKESAERPSGQPDTRPAPPPKPKKLSYKEAKEYESMEARIHEAEAVLEQKQTILHDPTVTSDPTRLRLAYEEMQAAQGVVDGLYARWAELESKLA